MIANAPIKRRRPVISKSPIKKMNAMIRTPAPYIQKPTQVSHADQSSLRLIGGITSARVLCHRSLTETI